MHVKESPMASTEQILQAARELGKLLASHEAAARFEAVIQKLQSDTEAQRLLNDYNRQMTTIAEKEATGKPIEVADKHQLQSLQQQVSANAMLRELQMAQMDYLDLMRRVDEAMSPMPAGEEAPGVPVPGPDQPA